MFQNTFVYYHNIFRDSNTNIGSTRILTNNKFRYYLWAL